jgi:hypothetical protein
LKDEGELVGYVLVSFTVADEEVFAEPPTAVG